MFSILCYYISGFSFRCIATERRDEVSDAASLAKYCTIPATFVPSSSMHIIVHEMVSGVRLSVHFRPSGTSQAGSMLPNTVRVAVTSSQEEYTPPCSRAQALSIVTTRLRSMCLKLGLGVRCTERVSTDEGVLRAGKEGSKYVRARRHCRHPVCPGIPQTALRIPPFSVDSAPSCGSADEGRALHFAEGPRQSSRSPTWKAGPCIYILYTRLCSLCLAHTHHD